jgi:Stress responsive A/B Barrel Domain
MIAHLVLLQPRKDLNEEQRRAALDTLAYAAANVPTVRSFRLGKRVKHGLPGYEQMMATDYEFALIIEVDDVAALTQYLRAPAHRALGDLFSTATAAALAYDFEMTDIVSPR